MEELLKFLLFLFSGFAVFLITQLLIILIKIYAKPRKKYPLKTRLLKKLRKQAKKRFRIKKGYVSDGSISKIGYIITYEGENVFYIQKDYDKYFPNVPYGLEYAKAILERERRNFVAGYAYDTKCGRKKKEIERQIEEENKKLAKL